MNQVIQRNLVQERQSQEKLLDSLIKGFSNTLQVNNKKLNITSKVNQDRDISVSHGWSIIFSRLISKVARIAKYDSVEILIQESNINVYFKNWNEDMNLFTDQDIIYSLKYLDETGDNEKIEVKSSTIKSKTIMFGIKFA